MTEKQKDPRLASGLKSFGLAIFWFVLGAFWTDMSDLFRYTCAAAGIAFIVEGAIQFRKRSKELDQQKPTE